MDKIVITIFQGSVVTQTVLGGLTMHHPVANSLQCICAKNYENWLTVDKVIEMKTVCGFFRPTRYKCTRRWNWSPQRVKLNNAWDYRDDGTYYGLPTNPNHP